MAPISPTELLQRGARRGAPPRTSRQRIAQERVEVPYQPQTTTPVTRQQFHAGVGDHQLGGEGDDEGSLGEDDGENTADIEDGNTLLDEDIDIEALQAEGAIDEAPMDLDNHFDTTGLKEIGNLASWTVSTYKPGCGVEALRDEDTSLFWQSDGPQPHHLNIHFSRLVSIVSIRLYLDFEADESYTPTRITLLAGTGYHDLLPFSTLEFTQPKGWIDVGLDAVGGGADGKELRCFLVQVKVVENHQNGKDTHLRGLRIYARDERGVASGAEGMSDIFEARHSEGSIVKSGRRGKPPVRNMSMLTEPAWMGEVEMR